LRIGFSPDLSMFPVDPKIAAKIGEAVGAFREQGAKVVPLKFDLAYSRQELTEACWCMTFFTNMTGNPAVSIPAGLVDGLPVGMQIIGPPHGDVNVLAAGAAFEQARPWLGIYHTIRR
jgi:Asp-tRNA(Asn)/Glu-tRNA(Gln) amidotransferase A subunit family amidase